MPQPAARPRTRTARTAVALAQQEKSTWTRADVIKYLGRVLARTGRDPAATAALLEDLAARALRSEFEPVVCLEAPEPADVPHSLLRADGRSVYQRHGGIRYATRAQLVMEERMVAQARASAAPRLTRAQAAHTLGANPEQLDAALTGHAQATPDTRTQSGLREDQAAAAMSVLTDGQRASVINAPAGAGKTRVATELGRAWAAAGLGPVVGITAAQSARNTLAAGVPASYNAAQFLGHLPGRRGARGPIETGPRPLLLVDEASTMPGPDLADLVAYADACDGKLILAGDTSQLQAVANGGGMSLLAGALGYVRLTEPPWPTPTTWPCCTRSGPRKPPPPGCSATALCSPPPCRPNTAASPATRPVGCGAPCVPPNWLAWTQPRSWPRPSPSGTWPGPATWPPSSTPGSATGSAP